MCRSERNKQSVALALQFQRRGGNRSFQIPNIYLPTDKPDWSPTLRKRPELSWVSNQVDRFSSNRDFFRSRGGTTVWYVVWLGTTFRVNLLETELPRESEIREHPQVREPQISMWETLRGGWPREASVESRRSSYWWTKECRQQEVGSNWGVLRTKYSPALGDQEKKSSHQL